MTTTERGKWWIWNTPLWDSRSRFEPTKRKKRKVCFFCKKVMFCWLEGVFRLKKSWCDTDFLILHWIAPCIGHILQDCRHVGMSEAPAYNQYFRQHRMCYGGTCRLHTVTCTQICPSSCIIFKKMPATDPKSYKSPTECVGGRTGFVGPTHAAQKYVHAWG